MFTLTRVFAAILLAVFAAATAGPYDTLYGADRPLQNLLPLLAGTGFVVGWSFLGGKARLLWLSAYLGVQGVVLTGVFAAFLASIRDVFVLGYRRQYRDPVDAVLGIPQLTVDYLSRTLDAQFLAMLLVGGIVLGLVVHVIDRALDRRRTDR